MTNETQGTEAAPATSATVAVTGTTTTSPLYAAHELDNDAVNNGVDVIYAEEQIFTLRSTQSKVYKAKLNTWIAQNRNRLMRGQVTDAETEARDFKLFIDCLLVSWRGQKITDRSGKVLPYSPDNARALFADLPMLFKDLERIADTTATYNKAQLEEMKGN